MAISKHISNSSTDPRLNAESEVANYYNSNTARFLGSKKKKLAGAIHRRLVPPEASIETRPEHYSESLVLEILKNVGAKRVLDLGCGVGGSIRYLRSQYQAEYTGISLSTVQCEIARQFHTFIENGSYLDPQRYENREPFDVIYAIESLQHNPSHQRLARNLKNVMKQKSRLIIIDDFLVDELPHSSAITRLIKRFRKYWHSHGYTDKTTFIETMHRNGFRLEREMDLTALMRKPHLNRHLRSALLHCLCIFPLKYPAMDNLIGGGTLVLLQQMGLSGYYLLVFGKD